MSFQKEHVHGVAIFVVILFCSTFFLPRWADVNQNSRLNMVVAVVKDGTFRIDKYVHNTVDYAKVGDHYYSDKAPGIAFLGIPIYAAALPLLESPLVDQLTAKLANSEAFQTTLRADGSGVLDEKVHFALTQVILSFVLGALPTALISLLLFNVLALFRFTKRVRIGSALAYGLLTPAFAYSNSMYGHQLSAALLFSAFAILLHYDQRIQSGEADAVERNGFFRFFAVGLLLGYSVVTEYPTVLPVLILASYALLLLARRRAYLSIAGGLLGLSLCAVGLMVYNNALFGGPFELGYSNSELWTDQHHTGFMSLTLPRLEAFWGIAFSPFRGIFLFSPWLLLFLPGLAVWWKTRQFRVAEIVTLAIVGSIVLFNAASSMWWGGFAVGPRYLLPALPFVMLPVAFMWEHFQQRKGFQILNGFLMVWSFVAVWGMTLAGQSFPSDALRNPWRDHALLAWLSDDIARNLGTLVGLEGFRSLLLLAAGVAFIALLWIIAVYQKQINEADTGRSGQSSIHESSPKAIGH